MKVSKGVIPFVALITFIAITAVFAIKARAATDPNLGAAAPFSVLAQTAITGGGGSTISGNVGMNSTGAAITGLIAGNVGGAIFSTDGAAPSGITLLSPTVQSEASTAFTTTIPAQAPDSSQGPVLDGLTLTPGTYDIGAGRLNGGVLTLDGAGIYIFRASSDFVSSGSINLINGARACDLFWRVQTLATINGSSFVGTILAGTGVHFGANVSLDGRALAVGGDVTMINDTISGPTCVVPIVPVVPTPPPFQQGNGSDYWKFHTGATSTPVVATTTPIVATTTSSTTVAPIVVPEISTTTATIIPLSSIPSTGYGLAEAWPRYVAIIVISAIVAFLAAFFFIGFVF